MNSKCVKDQNIRPKAIKFPEEKRGRTFFGINCSDICIFICLLRQRELKQK